MDHNITSGLDGDKDPDEEEDDVAEEETMWQASRRYQQDSPPKQTLVVDMHPIVFDDIDSTSEWVEEGHLPEFDLDDLGWMALDDEPLIALDMTNTSHFTTTVDVPEESDVSEPKEHDDVDGDDDPILSSGKRQANINIADGKKNAVILESEAAMMDQVNRARGEAEAIIARANATATGINVISESIQSIGGVEAASLRIAEQYIQAFSKIAKEGTTMLLPSDVANPANMMAQALSIYKGVIGDKFPGGKEGTVPKVQEKRTQTKGSIEHISEEDVDNFGSDSTSTDNLRADSRPNLLPSVQGFSLQSSKERFD
ncbi:hypothetical protein KI387_041365 [Taxus chinensis]|uniref:STML2-like C-terminal extension domain-containing protein n=1 Tax=Taxus chinensis TaxID=29808 RepID=A0AA38C4H2_TAXCH|nr:hypothetical protein KI387_041365 [Taxus chinensis]